MQKINKNIEEAKRGLPKGIRGPINQQMTDIAKSAYGDKYGLPDTEKNLKYGLEGGHQIMRNGIFADGPFSLGNGKLSPDTLIINFTSALECPSKDDCPMAQLSCYAVAGEIRLHDTRKKNFAIQDLWSKAYQHGDLQKMFDVAETYISLLNTSKNADGTNRYKTGVKYIRYNEAGDFPNMAFVQAAAAFSKKMRDLYGVISMAYTARVGIDFSQPLRGTDIPIDHIIKINASRADVKRSKDIVNQTFYGIPMGFKEEITNNEKAEFITFKDLDSLKYIPPTDIGTVHNIKSAPYLQYGKWTGGEGLYYICPCSFAIRDKQRINAKYFIIGGVMPGFEKMPNPDQGTINSAAEQLNDTLSRQLVKKLPQNLRNMREEEIKHIKSPCGIDCAVCHDMEGGIMPDGSRELNYNVLTATHGALASNYKAGYSEKKRMGDDSAVYSPENPTGRILKYDKRVSQKPYRQNRDIPIRPELINMVPEPGDEIKTNVSESSRQINEQKEKFWKMFNRINNVKF